MGATLSAPIVGMALRINKRIKDYKEFGPDYDPTAAKAETDGSDDVEKGSDEAQKAEPAGASQAG